MMIALVLAGALLCLSVALFFGPPLVIYGMNGLRDAFARPEAKLVSVGLGCAFALLLLVPAGASGLISGGKTVQVVAETPTGPGAG